MEPTMVHRPEEDGSPTACSCQLAAWVERAYSGGMRGRLIEIAHRTARDMLAHMEFEETWLIPRLTNRQLAERLLMDHRLIRAAMRDRAASATPLLYEFVVKHSRLEDYLVKTDSMLNILMDGT